MRMLNLSIFLSKWTKTNSLETKDKFTHMHTYSFLHVRNNFAVCRHIHTLSHLFTHARMHTHTYTHYLSKYLATSSSVTQSGCSAFRRNLSPMNFSTAPCVVRPIASLDRNIAATQLWEQSAYGHSLM